MKIIEFAFIAYPVTDLPRARAFYEGVLGFTREATPNDADAHWFEYEVGPFTLGIGAHPAWKPSSDGPCLALEVENFDEAIAHLKQHGIAFHTGPLDTPVCRMAVIQDPDETKSPSTSATPGAEGLRSPNLFASQGKEGSPLAHALGANGDVDGLSASRRDFDCGRDCPLYAGSLRNMRAVLSRHVRRLLS